MDKLGAKQLVALAIGIDPYSKEELTPTQVAKQKMLLEHLNDAYLRAAGWAFEAGQRITADDDKLSALEGHPYPRRIPADGHSPVPGKWPSLPTHAGRTGLLPTEELTLEFDGLFWLAGGHLLVDVFKVLQWQHDFGLL